MSGYGTRSGLPALLYNTLGSMASHLLNTSSQFTMNSCGHPRVKRYDALDTHNLLQAQTDFEDFAAPSRASHLEGRDSNAAATGGHCCQAGHAFALHDNPLHGVLAH